MPMQGPQAHSKTLAPLARISDRAPQSASIDRTCLEPGEMDRLTSGLMVFPLSKAATFSISNRDELVQEPMQTWSTLVPLSDSTSTTLSGLWGHAIIGFREDRSMSMTLS